METPTAYRTTPVCSEPYQFALIQREFPSERCQLLGGVWAGGEGKVGVRLVVREAHDSYEVLPDSVHGGQDLGRGRGRGRGWVVRSEGLRGWGVGGGGGGEEGDLT